MDGQQWDCQFCEKNNLRIARNCQGLYPGKFSVRVIDKVFIQCPVSVIDDPEIGECLNIINICEGGGMGGSRVLASQLVEEPAFYFNLRSVIMGEKYRIEQWRKQKEKSKKQK